METNRMKRIGAAATLSFVLLASVSPAFAQVDLRDKKGVVDPRDLKKYDPPERSLRITEPPPPQTAPRDSNYDVNSSSGTAPRYPSDQGGTPGRRPMFVPGPRATHR